MADTEFVRDTPQLLLNLPADIWQPLNKYELLSLYEEMRTYSRSEDFFPNHALSVDETAVLIFLYYLNESPTHPTITTYLHYLCDFINYSKKSFTLIQFWDVRDYISYLENDKQRLPRTIKTAMGGIRSFFRRMVAAGFLKANPTQLVRERNKHEREERIAEIATSSLSIEEVDTALESLKEASKEDDLALRNYSLFVTLVRIGLRAVEACNLNWEDLKRIENSWYFDVMGKGRKRRVIALPDQVIESILLLRERLYGIPSRTISSSVIAKLPIFTNFKKVKKRLTRFDVYYIIRIIAKSEQFDKHVHPHKLRGTCFTHLTRLGVPIQDVQRAAGHEDIGTTSLYVEAGNIQNSATLVFNKQKSS